MVTKIRPMIRVYRDPLYGDWLRTCNACAQTWYFSTHTGAITDADEHAAREMAAAGLPRSFRQSSKRTRIW